MYKRIMVPLDGSPTAEQVIPHAVALTKLLDADLTLIRILEPLPPARGVSPSAIRSLKKQAKEWAEEYFERIREDIAHQGVQVKTEIIEGRPGAMITQYAEDNDIDLIILCSRGRSGLSRWLMGGVADRVLRGATVPVLLVPADTSQIGSEAMS